MIKVEEIYDATNGGLDVLCHFYKEIDKANPKKPLKIRPDDKRPSAGVFQKKGVWFIKDHGGTDQKAYTAIELVKDRLNLSFKEAIDWIAQNFAPQLLSSASSNNTIAFKPGMKKEAPSSEMRLVRRPSGLFTAQELEVLGHKITQEMCNEFNLIPLDGYITKAKKDYSWLIESNEQYPIMFYDYGDWGKIYQPYGDLRFMYFGEKPKDFIFGTKKFMKVWKDALKGKYPQKPIDKNNTDDDYTNPDNEDERFEDLIICSGPSDALNVYGAGYEVCWFNSESEPISNNHLQKLKRICKNLYVLFDADETGKRNAQKIALQDLDIKIISLPEDLGKYTTNKRDSSGNAKPCKDIKDYMTFYKRGQINPRYEFKNRLVKLAKQLKFWTETKSDKGRVSYDISHACMFKFLSATGFYKMATGNYFRYVYVKDKIVDVIPEVNIVGRVRNHLVQFIQDNPEYYTIGLENMILRNKILTADSFQNLETIELNFDSYSATEEYFFFRNIIVRVTADAIEKVDPLKSPFNVISDKVIKHDLLISEPLYNVNTSEKYDYANGLLSQYSPDTPDYFEIKQEIAKMTNSEKYSLEILRDFDFLNFVYNTGNKFWREEQKALSNGSELTPSERKIIDINFISKCSTLGYLLSKYRSPSSGKAVYCMEIAVDELEEGQHNGGTGKSLFLDSLKYMRNRVFIDGQKIDKNKMDFIFQRVDFDSDIVHIDDLNSRVDLNLFLPSITNDLTVNPKNKDEFIIPMTKSPKFAFTSNHAISRFYGSLRRRIQFCGFSDYYHSENPETGLKENSPKIEFGRNLLFDYSDEDMNTFYNFMLQCVQLYLRYGLIEADMGDIEKRQKENKIGMDFIDWADNYFEDRLDQDINKELAFIAYKESLSKYGSGYVKKNTFTKKLIWWCEIRGYEYNPGWYMENKSMTERKRNEVRFTDMYGNQCYGFYISSKRTGD